MSRTRLILLPLLPLLILAVSLGLTWMVWDHERQAARKELQAQFDFSLREAVSRVEQRMAAYEQMLRGVQGLYSASDSIGRENFKSYVKSLEPGADFSGGQGLGLAQVVVPSTCTPRRCVSKAFPSTASNLKASAASMHP